MSVVLCLPAHLCVSPQRPVAGPPRERVTVTNVSLVEGHLSLPVGVTFVLLRVQDRCPFGLVCSPEGLLQRPQEVCALEVWPGHGLQCGGLGGVVGDRGLVEDVDAGVNFRRCRVLGTGSCGGGPCPPRPSQATRRSITP